MVGLVSDKDILIWLGRWLEWCATLKFDSSFSRIVEGTSFMNTENRAILIDDDILVREAWLMRARSANKIISVYESIESFRKVASTVSRQLPIFIDSNLGNGVKGEEFARELFGEGFTELYLATGYPASSFKTMDWIKGIVSKDPPDWLFKGN